MENLPFSVWNLAQKNKVLKIMSLCFFSNIPTTYHTL